MKIAIFSDNFYPELSGVADSIITLARELGKAGHKINFYAPKYSAKNFDTVKLPYKEADLGPNIEINRFFSFPYPTATKQGRLVLPRPIHWLKLKRFKPDIIHSQMFFGVGLDALISAKLFRIPFVGTNHTAIAEFVRYSPIKAQWFSRAMLRYVSWYYNRCNFVTAPSASVFEEMRPSGFRKPSQVLSNPIDADVYNMKLAGRKEEFKKKFGLSPATLIFAGRLAKEKYIDILIRAVAEVKKEIPDIMLALTGHGGEEENLKALAKELGVAENIKFLGTLEKQDLVEVFHASDIFVIASTSETQNLSLLQTMALGLPAVGVRARALPEYIREENGFLVEPGDYRAMAEKIVLLFKNIELRLKLGRGGLNLVQKFLSNNIAREWEALYAKIIADFHKKL